MELAKGIVKTEAREQAAIGEAIRDEEVFFRRVLPGSNHYTRTPDGIRISSQAFADRNFEPSVDRRALIEYLSLGGPAFTQGEPANGVLRIQARDVRGVEFTHSPAKQQPESYKADIHPWPLENNPTHCVIRLQPTTDKASVFKKLLERLALLAKWQIHPRDLAETGDRP